MSVLYGTSPVCIPMGREEGPTARSFLTVSAPQENGGSISRRVLLRISILHSAARLTVAVMHSLERGRTADAPNQTVNSNWLA